jgi:hypothetical protein
MTFGVINGHVCQICRIVHRKFHIAHPTRNSASPFCRFFPVAAAESYGKDGNNRSKKEDVLEIIHNYWCFV